MKKKTEDKYIKVIRKLIVNGGDVMLLLYILVSSLLLSQYMIQNIYLKNEHLFIEYLINYNGWKILNLFWVTGVFITGIWVSIGILFMTAYKHQIKLLSKGFKKDKSILEKAIFPEKKEVPKKKEEK